MTHKGISVLALAISAGWALPANAQSANDAAVLQELQTMRAQMEQMTQRIGTLEGQLAEARTKADTTQAKADTAQEKAETAMTATAKPATEITWDGAPKIATRDGWSFKPRGRLQMDTAGVDAPSGLVGGGNEHLGWGTEVRRAYIGFDGTMPGGFGYRVEADLAGGSVDLTDVYLTYKASPKLTLTLGQQKPFWGMEEMTSDLFTSFMERGSFNSAFGFERRLGASATYTDKSFLVQGGVFTDNINDLSGDTNNSYSFDGRVVFMPKIGDGQLHLGASAHFRDFNDQQSSTRYRARPFVHTTDLRLTDTRSFDATSERSFGAEAAYILGRFHASAESHWITANRPGLANPTFNGGYAELGYLLTDDTTAYKNGVYDRIRPKNPLGSGGIGAVQINARYDWLDLNDAGIIGGRQQTAGVGLIWMPTDYVRFLLDYGHMWIKDAAVPAGTDKNYTANVVGMRAQFDF